MRLPERISKGQSTKSNAQRKRQKSPPEQNESRRSYSEQDGISNLSYQHLSQSSTSFVPKHSTLATASVDLNESPIPNVSTSPESFIHATETSTYSDFARYLGPDSIEDIFGQQYRKTRSLVSPYIGSTATDPFQNVVSLDQYVSTLDLQNELAWPQDVNNSASGTSSLQCAGLDNATIDHAGQPFIPLSPYIMQMQPPGGYFLVSPESYAPFTNESYMIDPVADSQVT
jgi:hypothetical protein